MKRKLLLIALAFSLVFSLSMAAGCKTVQPHKPCTHSYGDWIIDTDATCTATGSKHHVCTICKNEESETIEAKGHTYGDWEDVTVATCTTDGFKTRTCTKCGYEESEGVAKLDHTYSDDSVVCTVCHKYYIDSTDKFIAYIEDVQNYESKYSRVDSVLDCDVDLEGHAFDWTGTALGVFTGGFDGQNHTVSNFTIKRDGWYAGLFSYAMGGTVKNLIVKNANVSGTKWVGVIFGGMYNYDDGVVRSPLVENCHIENCTVSGTKRVGGIVGIFTNGTITGCSVKNSAISYSETPDDGTEYGGAIAGTVLADAVIDESSYSSDTSVVSGETISDGVLLNAKSEYLISNKAGLVWFRDQVNEHNNSFNGKTVKLTADIDCDNETWYPIGQNEKITTDTQEFFGTFDGAGHTIKNLTVKSHTVEQIKAIPNYDPDNLSYCVGFFGWLSGSVKRVTFENVNVSGYYHVGVIAGHLQQADGSSIEDCTVTNCKVTATHVDDGLCGDKVGGALGYLDVGATIKNVTVKDTTVTACRDAGQVVGCANTTVSIIDGCTAENVTVTAATDCCTDDNHGGNVKNEILGRDTSKE